MSLLVLVSHQAQPNKNLAKWIIVNKMGSLPA